MNKLFLPLSIILLLLCACSANQREVKPIPNVKIIQRPSEPNLHSLYYFSLGTFAFEQGEYDTANFLFHRAQEADPYSVTIYKRLLETTAERLKHNLISAPQAAAAADSLVLLIGDDPALLSIAFGIYAQAQAYQSMESILIRMDNLNPKASHFLMRYYFDLSFKKKISEIYVDKAFELAKADMQTLLYIAKIYDQINPPKAIPVLYEMRGLMPSVEVEEVLLRTLIKTKKLRQMRKLYEGYRYPEDAAFQSTYLEVATEMGQYQEVTRLAAKILKDADATLLARLAMAAYLQKDIKLLNRMDALLMNPRYTIPEFKDVKLILLANRLYRKQAPLPGDLETAIVQSADFSDLLHLWIWRKLGITEALKESHIRMLIDDIEQFLPRFQDSMYADYLRIFARESLMQTESDILLKERYKIVQYLLSRGLGTPDDLDFCFAYLHSIGEEDMKLSLLKEAVSRFPGEAVYHNDLGYSLLMQGNTGSEVQEMIATALNLDPENPHYLDSMAWYYYLIGDAKTALDYMRIPMQMEDMPSEVSYHIGMIFLKLEDFTAAKEYLQKALDAQDAFSDLAAEAIKNLQVPSKGQ